MREPLIKLLKFHNNILFFDKFKKIDSILAPAIAIKIFCE